MAKRIVYIMLPLNEDEAVALDYIGRWALRGAKRKGYEKAKVMIDAMEALLNRLRYVADQAWPGEE